MGGVESVQAFIILYGIPGLLVERDRNLGLVTLPVVVELGYGLDEEDVPDGVDSLDIGPEDALGRGGIVKDGNLYQQIDGSCWNLSYSYCVKCSGVPV